MKNINFFQSYGSLKLTNENATKYASNQTANFNGLTVHFHCLTLKFHNFKENQYFLILEKANTSSFFLVLFYCFLFVIVFKSFQDWLINVLKEDFFQDFFKTKLKMPMGILQNSNFSQR